jgi:lysophospholipase L1-like esterase
MLRISLVINILLLVAGLLALNRLGGWRYAWNRLSKPEMSWHSQRVDFYARMPEQPSAIVFLGDSHIENGEWQELLRPDSGLVLNRGITGDYCAGVLGRLDEVLRHRPRALYLLVGVNDLAYGESPEALAGPYQDIVARLRQQCPDAQLTLLSLPPVNTAIRDYGVDNAAVVAFNQQIAAIAQRYALRYLDLHAQLTDADGALARKFTNDGLHLNGLGYTVVASMLKKAN